jgi:hypothetical protein
MPTTKENRDIFEKVLSDFDDVELGALAQLIYESLLPANNKATSSELTTIGKQLYASSPWKPLVPALKIPVIRSGVHVKNNLAKIIRIAEIEARNGAAPNAESEGETRPETPEAKADGAKTDGTKVDASASRE